MDTSIIMILISINRMGLEYVTWLLEYNQMEKCTLRFVELMSFLNVFNFLEIKVCARASAH